MINRLKIENFKSIASETLELRKLNIITGVNCAGKSSVIQSILLFADAMQESLILKASSLEKLRTDLDKERKHQENIKKELLHLKDSLDLIKNNEHVDFERSLHMGGSLLKQLEELENQMVRLDAMDSAFEDASNHENGEFTFEKLRDWKFEKFYNKNERLDAISIGVNDGLCVISKDDVKMQHCNFDFAKNKDFIFLSESRSGPQNQEKLIATDEFGDEAEFVMGYFHRHKNDEIHPNLVLGESKTLSSNVDFWLSEILKGNEKEFDIQLNVATSTSETVTPSYVFCGLPNIEPTQLGAGVSYLAKILIVCLSAKPEQTVIIENPEMHLHPAAQSAVGHFLSFIASKGVQVIVETHCEHLINKIQHDVLKGLINSSDVAIFYKKSHMDGFDKFFIGKDGHFEENCERRYFPKGFFDATLNELMEIG